jgi:hypothetical protein
MPNTFTINKLKTHLVNGLQKHTKTDKNNIPPTGAATMGATLLKNDFFKNNTK